MILSLAKIIASGAGVGYIKKGSGTIAALLSCIIWYFSLKQADSSNWIIAGIIACIFIAGVWASTVVETQWGKDSSMVVIDEVGGMCVSLFLLPVSIQYIIMGFVLFRFFDIAKPFFIRRLEKLPSGWGVMADDLLAGIYTNLILQVIAKFNLC